MTRNEMILALTKSENRTVQRICTNIVQSGFNDEVIKIEISHCGSFLKSVLIGDYRGALDHADPLNYIALMREKIIERLQKEIDENMNFKIPMKIKEIHLTIEL